MALDVAAQVLANLPLSADFNRLSLAAPAIAAATAPGQFVMVKANTSHDPLLRRPFSVFEVLRTGEGTATGLTILNKRIGATTRLLYDAKPGQRIACLGPLGLPWPVIDAGTEREACLRGVSLVLTTEDGSAGEHGRVTAPLERHLAERQSAAAVYACGPEAMMAAVARMAMRFACVCHVSLERVMGCGLGGCYSCVVPVRGEAGGFHHLRSCIAGPVMSGDRILWD